MESIISKILGIDAEKFQAGKEAGRKPVKLACGLGASYDAAEILAPLSVARTAAEITAAYAALPQGSCMAGKDVGPFYAQLGVECLWSPNFRALVLPHPDRAGAWVTPRAYGIHRERVLALLGDTLVEWPEAFSRAIPTEEYLWERRERVVDQEGVYRYDYRYEVTGIVTNHLRDEVRAQGPFPFWPWDLPALWRREEDRIKAEAVAAFPGGYYLSSDGMSIRPETMYTRVGGVLVQLTPVVTRRTVIRPTLYAVRVQRVAATRHVQPDVRFIPYPDYPEVCHFRPAEWIDYDVASPTPWERIAHDVESRFNGYVY